MEQNKHQIRAALLRGVLLWLLFIVVLIFFILFPIIYINAKTSKTLEFTLNSLSVSPLLIYSSSITASWDVTLQATNPHKDKIVYYDAVQLSVFYNKMFLTSSNIPMNGSLYQSPGNVTWLQGNPAVSSVYIWDSEEASAILEEWRNGIVTFGIQVDAILRLGADEKHLERKLVSANCNFLQVQISQNQTAGSFLGGSRNCDVKE